MGVDATVPVRFHLLVTREEWGARPAKKLPILNHPVPLLRYTHTNTNECTSESECLTAMRNIQRSHMSRGFNDVKFNFVIGGDGRVYEGRGWHFEGEIPEFYRKEKKQTIDFGFIGNYLTKEKPMKPEMTDVARGLIEWGIKRKILKIPFDVQEYYDEWSEDMN